MTGSKYTVGAFWLALVFGSGGAALAEAQPESTAERIRIIGSDTMGELVDRWAEAYSNRSGQALQVESEGSVTAPPALAEGRADLAPMSRPLTGVELAGLEEALGGPPLSVTVARGAIAIYVHEDNPLYGITTDQLGRLFAADEACGGPAIRQWDQIALGVNGQARVTLHGRDSRSGTYGFFADAVLCGGAFAADVIEHPDSEDLIDSIAADPLAIGYAGLGFRRAGVRTLAVAEGSDPTEARYFPLEIERFLDDPDPARRYAFVLAGRYPLSRDLRILVRKGEGEALPGDVKAFLEFALSEEGQAIVEEIGFVPLPDRQIRDELQKLRPETRPRRRWLR